VGGRSPQPEPLARAALDDIKQGRRPEGPFFVQYVAVDDDGHFFVPPSSQNALIAAAHLIGADARSGNSRWRQSVFRLRRSGLVPRSEIEVT